MRRRGRTVLESVRCADFPPHGGCQCPFPTTFPQTTRCARASFPRSSHSWSRYANQSSSGDRPGRPRARSRSRSPPPQTASTSTSGLCFSTPWIFAASPGATAPTARAGRRPPSGRWEFRQLGHEVKLIPPIYVKPFVKRQKNDAADAEAICEAAQRPTMRFVAVRTEEQQARGMLFRTRDLLVRQRTQTINAAWSPGAVRRHRSAGAGPFRAAGMGQWRIRTLSCRNRSRSRVAFCSLRPTSSEVKIGVLPQFEVPSDPSSSRIVSRKEAA